MTVARSLLMALLGLLVAADGASGGDNPRSPRESKPATGVEVKIRFSVKELDPKQPGDSYLECTVRNLTEKPIRVPTVYTRGFDSEMVLYGSSLRRHTLRLACWDRKRTQKHTTLERGKVTTIFKSPLKDLLRLTSQDPKKRPNRPLESWTWEA